jgi:hypothetical protein
MVELGGRVDISHLSAGTDHLATNVEVTPTLVISGSGIASSVCKYAKQDLFVLGKRRLAYRRYYHISLCAHWPC